MGGSFSRKVRNTHSRLSRITLHAITILPLLYCYITALYDAGGWEGNETLEQATQREAFEEAGVSGCLERPFFGIYEYDSKKADPKSIKGRTVYTFIMHVQKEYETWPEMHSRKRQWVRTVGTVVQNFIIACLGSQSDTHSS